jgi:hypothetical protein
MLSLSDLDDSDVLVWSMLVRADYGGMKGDVDMLHQYARLWKTRFLEKETALSVPDRLIQQLNGAPAAATANSTSAGVVGGVSWTDIPRLVHRTPHEQALERVPGIGIEALEIEDTTLEGIDFHCSSVLDDLLKDARLVSVCHDLLVLSSWADDIPTTAQERRAWLLDFWKSCMWKHSAGINHRRPLLVASTCSSSIPGASSNNKEPCESCSAMWTELVAPKVHEYQRAYVKQRLSGAMGTKWK